MSSMIDRVSQSIRHLRKTHMSSEIVYNTRTLFGTHETHMLNEIDYKSRALFGTHTKGTY